MEEDGCENYTPAEDVDSKHAYPVLANEFHIVCKCRREIVVTKGKYLQENDSNSKISDDKQTDSSEINDEKRIMRDIEPLTPENGVEQQTVDGNETSEKTCVVKLCETVASEDRVVLLTPQNEAKHSVKDVNCSTEQYVDLVTEIIQTNVHDKIESVDCIRALPAMENDKGVNLNVIEYTCIVTQVEETPAVNVILEQNNHNVIDDAVHEYVNAEHVIPMAEPADAHSQVKVNGDQQSNNCFSPKENQTCENNYTENDQGLFTLKLAHLNVNGWNVNNCEIRQQLLSYSQADFICVNETHLSGNENIMLPGYHWIGYNRAFQHVRAVRSFGGVGIFFKDSIAEEFTYKIIDKNCDGILMVLFQHKFSEFRLLICACYLPPEHSKWGRDGTAFFAHILNEIYLQENIDAIVLAGDMNARIGKMQDTIDTIDEVNARKVIDDKTNQHGIAFIEFLQESCMCILNGRYDPEFDCFTSVSTKGSAVVDYICTMKDQLHMFHDFKVESCLDIVNTLGIQHLVGARSKIPDHAMLSCEFDINVSTNDKAEPSYSGTAFQKFHVNNIPGDFLSCEASARILLTLIEQVELCRESQGEIDQLYSDVCDVILAEMKVKLKPKCARNDKIGKRHKPRKPFWNGELDELFKKMTYKEREFRKCKLRSRKRDKRHEFKLARHQFDKAFRKLERRYKRGQMLEIDEFCTANPNKFWSQVKNLGPRKGSSIPMEVYNTDKDVVGDIDTVLNTWKESFASLYNQSNYRLDEDFDRNLKTNIYLSEQVMQDPLYTPSDTLNKDITLNEVKLVTKSAKFKKAVGIDMIPNEVLKNPNLLNLMHNLFQLCFDSGKIPQPWTQAIIHPIPKSKENDQRIPLNYRGISLLSCMSKMFTSLLNNRITAFMENRQTISDEQNGFRKDRSCTDHIFVLHSILKSRKLAGKDTFVTYIDFSKAFDGVNREMLLYKLIANGVDGKMYFIIKALYSKTSACINVNNRLTEWFDTILGVRQGDCLSPTLFNTFINDLAVGIKLLNMGVQVGEEKIPILLYADDVALITESEEDMQFLLNFTHHWCETWHMKINMSKSKVTHFRKQGQARSDTQLKIGDANIEYVDKYKYLGVFFDEFLLFDTHSEVMTKSGGRALGAVIAKYKKLENMGFDTYTKLFESGVIPVINYGTEVLGYLKNMKSDSIQTKAIKIFLGVHRFASNDAVQGDMGWLPNHLKRKLNVLRYWNRLIDMDTTRLTRKVFDSEYACNRKGSWCLFVKDTLTELDMANIYTAKMSCDLALCKTRLFTLYANTWSNNVKKKPKLRVYRLIKTEFVTDRYITLNLERHERSILAQLRTGVLPLHVETGRFENKKLEDRKCKLCDTENVEDEYHFLFHCSFYDNLRHAFYTDIILEEIEDEARLKKLFISHTRRFAKYVCNIFNKRKDGLYVTANRQ